MSIRWHDEELRELWQAGDLATVEAHLRAHGVFAFPAYQSGLRPASSLPPELARETGYGYAWLRDNCNVAYALWRAGEVQQAARIARAVLQVLTGSRDALTAIIDGSASADDVMSRPPVRVDGDTLAASGEWPNAQNDALGYSLWLVGSLTSAGVLSLGSVEVETLALVVDYLAAIPYWTDLDSGHWEEARKLNMSSVGTVVAGLRAIQPLLDVDVSPLVAHGQEVLRATLPHETVTPPELARDADSALIFLAEPLRVLSGPEADRVVESVTDALCRPIGYARYAGDSYWAPDYRRHFGLGERSADFSDSVGARDAYAVTGAEAQWSIFDPMVSAHWGHRFRDTGLPAYQERQRWHLERSLAQFYRDGATLKVPEAYFLENGQWVPNDHSPLLWTEANLMVALLAMRG